MNACAVCERYRDRIQVAFEKHDVRLLKLMRLLYNAHRDDQHYHPKEVNHVRH